MVDYLSDFMEGCILESLSLILDNISTNIYVYVTMWVLGFCGLYFSFKLKFAQVWLLPDSVKYLKEKSHKGSVSSFQAIMTCTASKVGTANIAGVATAVVVGGPGAIFWMWLMALIGSASSIVEATLAQMYKVKEINLMPNSKSSLAANEKTYSSDYLMKVGIDAFTTNQAFSRVIELTADNFLLPYSCQAFGTLVPRAWHSSANAVAQLCQRLGTNL